MYIILYIELYYVSRDVVMSRRQVLERRIFLRETSTSYTYVFMYWKLYTPIYWKWNFW